jgi:hypothetical protein
MQRQYQTVENRDVVDERSIVEADFYARRFKEFLFGRVFRCDKTILSLTTSLSNIDRVQTRNSLYPSLTEL